MFSALVSDQAPYLRKKAFSTRVWCVVRSKDFTLQISNFKKTGNLLILKNTLVAGMSDLMRKKHSILQLDSFQNKSLSQKATKLKFNCSY